VITARIDSIRLTVLAEPGDRAVDEARILAARRLGAEPEPLHHARARVLDDDVRDPREPLREAPVGVALQVEAEAPFAAVERREVAALAASERRRVAEEVPLR
jgi:hypothetical protein